MLSNLLSLPCQIVRRTPSGEKDAYGNKKRSETVTETTREGQP